MQYVSIENSLGRALKSQVKTEFSKLYRFPPARQALSDRPVGFCWAAEHQVKVVPWQYPLLCWIWAAFKSRGMLGRHSTRLSFLLPAVIVAK